MIVWVFQTFLFAELMDGLQHRQGIFT